MENKQKLPKHIIARVSTHGYPTGRVTLQNKLTGKCWNVDPTSSLDLKRAVNWLEDGQGWEVDKNVGKQIVF